MPGRIDCLGSGPDLEATDVACSAGWGQVGHATTVTVTAGSNDQRGTIQVESLGRDPQEQLHLTTMAAADSCDITYNTHESTLAITSPAGGIGDITAAQVKATLLTISDFTGLDADITVTKVSSGVFTIDFSGTLGHTALASVLTVTSVTGTAAGHFETPLVLGATIAADPTVTVTFKRPWGTIPTVIVSGHGTVANSTLWAVTAASKTAFTVTLDLAAPVVAAHYVFDYFVIG